MYIDINIVDVNSRMRYDTEGVQQIARHVWGSCLVGAHKGFSRPGRSRGGEPEPEPDRPRRLGFPCALSGACETEEHLRPARAHQQDLSGARGGDGRGLWRPLKRGAVDAAEAP